MTLLEMRCWDSVLAAWRVGVRLLSGRYPVEMLILAALLLFALQVVPALWGVAVVAGAIAFEVVEKGFWVRYTRRIPLAMGPETMIGRPVTVVSTCRPVGRVRFGSESWRARCRDGAGVGESLVIDTVENMTLIVSKPSPGTTPTADTEPRLVTAIG